MRSITDKEPTAAPPRTTGVPSVRAIVLVLASALAAAPAIAAEPSSKKPRPASKSVLEKDSSAARDRLSVAVDEYKASLADLIALQSKNVAAAETKVAKLRELLSTQIVSRREVETAELELARARADADRTKIELEHADNILEEVAAADKLLDLPDRPGGYVATAAVIRYSGTRWNISDVGKVDGFFTSRFGRRAPISAFGQTSLHARLGYDHSNAIDVATHPDSPEGQALMSYLRASGIPFLAFRSAIPGKATGPHIHIGLPSRRMYR